MTHFWFCTADARPFVPCHKPPNLFPTNTPNERKGYRTFVPIRSAIPAKPTDASFFEHVMPVQTPNLAPRDRHLPHSPPHRSHLPASPPSGRPGPVNTCIRYWLPDVPTPPSQLLDDPAQPLVGVLALPKRGDGFVAQFDDFEGERRGRKEDVGWSWGVEEC